MQIVIDITDSDKEIIDNGFKPSEVSVNFYRRLIMSIQQGTTLPKGHGRLIDANNLMEYCLNQKSKMIGCNDIARFGTIIPADKEE